MNCLKSVRKKKKKVRHIAAASHNLSAHHWHEQQNTHVPATAYSVAYNVGYRYVVDLMMMSMNQVLMFKVLNVSSIITTTDEMFLCSVSQQNAGLTYGDPQPATYIYSHLWTLSTLQKSLVIQGQIHLSNVSFQFLLGTDICQENGRDEVKQ